MGSTVLMAFFDPDEEQTAASSAATHTQFAAVSTPPGQGPAQPAPAGGSQEAGPGQAPHLAGPAPPGQDPASPWTPSVEGPAQAQQPQPGAPFAPGAGAPPALQGQPGGPGIPAVAPPPTPGAAAPAGSVEALLKDAEATGVGLGTERPAEARGAKRGKKEQSPDEMRFGAMRLSVIVLIAIIVISLVAGSVRRGAVGEDNIFTIEAVDIIGVFALGAGLFLLVKAAQVGIKTKERTSSAEAGRLMYITLGGILLWLVPFIGSFGAEMGLMFQASAMHPIYYGFVGGGVLAILMGLSGSKEQGSYYKVFMFAVYGIVLSTIPVAFPVFGNVLASDFWWGSTFIMISIGFIFIAFTLRQMRQGQYAQLDGILQKAERSYSARRYDEAARIYSQAITLTHTLYSDSVFSIRNPRERRSSDIPDQYFRPWLGKARCLALTGKIRKAIAIYDLMLEVDPDNATVWADRGRLLMAEERHAEAYISFDRAAKLDPSLENAKRGRAEVLESIRKIQT